MRLKVIEIDFTTHNNWIFKFVDSNGCEYFIMNSSFYSENKMKSPISKKELDTLSVDHWLSANVLNINGIMTVIQLV